MDSLKSFAFITEILVNVYAKSNFIYMLCWVTLTSDLLQAPTNQEVQRRLRCRSMKGPEGKARKIWQLQKFIKTIKVIQSLFQSVQRDILLCDLERLPHEQSFMNQILQRFWNKVEKKNVFFFLIISFGFTFAHINWSIYKSSCSSPLLTLEIGYQRLCKEHGQKILKPNGTFL